MTTASIPELRKAHTRTRARLDQGGRTVRQTGTGRSCGEDGPHSDQEVALLAP